MKTCPVCRRVYTDETYSFCLEDGALLPLNDSELTLAMPTPSDVSVQTLYIPPTQKFQPDETVLFDVVQRLLNHLKDDNQKFSIIGRFRFNNEYIWTNGQFFEIADSIPSDLTDVFPLKENSAPVELVKSLINQLSTSYTIVQSIVPAQKEGVTDLISDKTTVRVNNIYFQYLQIRYPKAAIMTGTSPYNPLLFVSGGTLRAGIMGIKI